MAKQKRADGFYITMGRGFQICLNGVVLSVQFGYGNYCDNRDEATWPIDMQFKEQVNCPNAEVALFDATTGDWLTKKVWKGCFKESLGDDVTGYVTPDMLAKLMAWLHNTKRYWGKKDAKKN